MNATFSQNTSIYLLFISLRVHLRQRTLVHVVELSQFISNHAHNALDQILVYRLRHLQLETKDSIKLYCIYGYFNKENLNRRVGLSREKSLLMVGEWMRNYDDLSVNVFFIWIYYSILRQLLYNMAFRFVIGRYLYNMPSKHEGNNHISWVANEIRQFYESLLTIFKIAILTK